MSHEANATVVNPLPAPLRGSASVPGDKSISHRAVLFAAMAEGTSRLSGVLFCSRSEDGGNHVCL